MTSITTNSEAETSGLGADIAMALQPGDMLFLSGDLGVGKTTLARAIIRALAEDDALEVPSPTYSICQSYNARIKTHHLDLYRLSGVDEIEELGLHEMLEDGVVIVEWPENCFENDPGQVARFEISPLSDQTRQIEVSGNPGLMNRIKRSVLIRDFLNLNGLRNTDRKFLSGDASARAYELVNNGKNLLMNAPAMPDGPPVHNGKPYSKIAHLAEHISVFVAIDTLLDRAGVRVPEILSQDLENGLLLIENLGDSGIIDANRAPIFERYRTAVEMLAYLHAQELEPGVKLENGKVYSVPPYDHDAMMIEANLFMDWYVPDLGNSKVVRQEFVSIWSNLISILAKHPKTVVLRDFHSPNILWIDDAEGIDQVGVIDFQDAVVGPEAYDVASLAQDARVDVSAELETELVNHYVRLRQAGDPDFPEAAFRESYAIMAAQRATKILGIFVRLDKRDNKPQYRQHIPRILEYLKRSVQHPVLSEYKEWLSTVIKL